MEGVGAIIFVVLCAAVVGSFLFRLARGGMRDVGLGAKVVHERLRFQAESSGMGTQEVSVVITARRDAPIAVSVVRRLPLGVNATGANLTRDQAVALAELLRAAASDA